MGTYEEYISRLKGVRVALDDSRMYPRIEAKIAGRSRRIRLALEGALAVLLIGFAIYFNFYPRMPGSEETLTEYVFQQNDLNGDQILNYVFMD